jgi:hypothetical protein
MATITIRHPDIEGAVEVTQKAYEKAYKPKGWVADTSAGKAPDQPKDSRRGSKKSGSKPADDEGE